MARAMAYTISPAEFRLMLKLYAEKIATMTEREQLDHGLMDPTEPIRDLYGADIQMIIVYGKYAQGVEV